MFALFLLLAATAFPQTAILESRSEARHDGNLVLAFRTASAAGVVVSSARLHIRLRQPPAPPNLKIALVSGSWDTEHKPSIGPWRSVEVRSHGQNWISAELPPAWIEKLSEEVASGIAIAEADNLEGRNTALTQPLILIEGKRQQRRQ